MSVEVQRETVAWEKRAVRFIELPQKFATRNNDQSVIFPTGHGDIPLNVKAIKQCAVDFRFEKTIRLENKR